MTCFHCGCPQHLHIHLHAECQQCSCLEYLRPDGLPLDPEAGKPTSLDQAETFEAANVAPGTKLHLSVVGNHVTDDATFDERIELLWGDLLECWPIAPDDPDNLNTQEKIRRAAVKRGALLRLDVKCRPGSSVPLVSQYVRYEDCDEDGVLYIMHNDVLRVLWGQVTACRLIRQGERDPRYADGYPPDD